ARDGRLLRLKTKPRTLLPRRRYPDVAVRLSRIRDGAVGFALSHDVSDPTHWVETFRLRDWHELQRAIGRHNLADSEAVVRARSYHIDAEPPRLAMRLREHEE